MAREGFLSKILKRIGYGAAIFTLQHPRTLRAIATFLRRTGIWTRFAIVRFEDVTDVLSREHDFTSAEGYAPNILTGPFLLGLDNGALYAKDTALLRKVVRPSDLVGPDSVGARLGQYLAGQALQLRFDVVDDIAVRAATFVITDYFGVSDDPNLKMWLRRLAAFIVVGQVADAETRRLAQEAADGLLHHVQQVLTARKTSTPGPYGDDILGRLLAETNGAKLPEDEAMVVRNLTGLLWVSHAVIVQAITLSIDELMRHQEVLPAAQAAALLDDIEAVKSYTFEALRFNPVFPVLPRYCPRNTVVADRAGREHAIAADSKLLVWVIGAMFDPDKFADPAAFSTKRTLGDYLVFGHGVHQCFGEHLAYVELPQMMMAMLKLHGLQRASGGPAGIQYEGPAVAHLYLEYDPATAATPTAAGTVRL